MSSSLILIIVILVLLLFFFLRKKYFVFSSSNLFLANGGLGAGKTTLTLSLALKKHRSFVIRYYISFCIFRLLSFIPFPWFARKFNSLKREGVPVFYSNIPISNVKYAPLTKELLLGVENFSVKCVVYVGEASLIADSMSFKDFTTYELDKFSERIKLFRHATKGGHMFIDTQSFSDLIFVWKRCINSLVWIERCIKWFPFFIVFKLRSMNVSNENIENQVYSPQDETKTFIISKRIWKRYDTYCYYGLYQDLPVKRATFLKRRKIFRNPDLRVYDYFTLKNKKRTKR